MHTDPHLAARRQRHDILLAAGLVGLAVDLHDLEVVDMDVEGCSSRAVFLITHSSVVPSFATKVTLVALNCLPLM